MTPKSIFDEILIMNNIQQEEVKVPEQHDPWKVATAVMGASQRVLLRGKPGTGKTYHAVNAGLPEGQKVYSITMTEETPAAEIRGHYVLQGGDYIWSDGPAISAWREGARLVINEIDHASEDTMSLLYAIMDDPGHAQLTLPTKETVRPAEGFQIVATMNGQPEDLPEALQDRLPVDIEILEINPDALARLPEDLRSPAQSSAVQKTGQQGISIRMWLEFASLREKLPATLGDEALAVAAQAVFGENYKEALNALTVAEDASEPQAMDGTLVNKYDKTFFVDTKILYDSYYDTSKPPLFHDRHLFPLWRSIQEHQTLFTDITWDESLQLSVLMRTDGSRITLVDWMQSVA